MKATKKLLALVLALVMVLSLGITAYAGSGEPDPDPSGATTANGKIVIADAPDAVRYRAYQVFDATVVEGKVVYTMDTDSPWIDAILTLNSTDYKDFTVKEEAGKLDIVYDEAAGNYIVKAGMGFSPADFASYLKEVLREKGYGSMSFKESTRKDGTCEIEVADPGYYLILSGKDDAAAYEYNKTAATDPTYSLNDTAYGNLAAAQKALYNGFDCYYKTTDTAHGVIYTVDFFNTLSAADRDGYEAGKFYERKEAITEAEYKALKDAKDSENVVENTKYTLPADGYTFVGEQELIATQPAAPLADLYVQATGTYYTDGANLYTEDQYNLMDKSQQDTLSETTAYQRKAEITTEQFRALVTNEKWDELANYQSKAVSFVPTQTTAALTTVLPGQTVQVQNKNDMPLDKQVDKPDENGAYDNNYDDNNTGVKVGDELHYKILTKIPTGLAEDDFDYIFRVKDKMSSGLTLKDDKITIHIKNADGVNDVVTFTIVYDAETGKLDATQTTITVSDTDNTATQIPYELVTENRPLTGNEVRFYGTDEEGKEITFELSLAVASKWLRRYAGNNVVIEYSGVVNDSAVAELLLNTAVLVYGDSNDLTIKDAETDNYISNIIIDKFETGNRSQKLPGAEFALYKMGAPEDNPETIDVDESKGDPVPYYYVLKGKAPGADEGADKVVIPYAYFVDGKPVKTKTDDTLGYQVPELDGEDKYQYYTDLEVSYVAGTENAEAMTGITKVCTDINGYAQFAYLEDGTYYLVETKAPIDYAKLLGPMEIEVDGSMATDHRLTDKQRIDALTNIANVANTNGSSMPSTGGVGATMMTIGGIALILAAGAFLVLRRRKEQE